MGSSETTISGPKTCQAILKIRLQKKSTNTKIVGIEIMKPSYLMELFCYFTFLGYRETFLDLKRLFLMIPLYFLFRIPINTIFYVHWVLSPILIKNNASAKSFHNSILGFKWNLQLPIRSKFSVGFLRKKIFLGFHYVESIYYILIVINW